MCGARVQAWVPRKDQVAAYYTFDNTNDQGHDDSENGLDLQVCISFRHCDCLFVVIDDDVGDGIGHVDDDQLCAGLSTDVWQRRAR